MKINLNQVTTFIQKNFFFIIGAALLFHFWFTKWNGAEYEKNKLIRDRSCLCFTQPYLQTNSVYITYIYRFSDNYYYYTYVATT